MAISKITTPIDAPVAFITPELTLDVHADKVTLVRKEKRLVDCVLTIIASPEVYQVIDEQGWFHLQSMHRKAEPTFDPDEPLELELKLSSVYLPMVLGKDVDIQQFIDVLVDVSRKREVYYLLDPKNWYALYVKQDVPLPTEFAPSTNHLKIGYATVWTENSHEPLFELVQTYFLTLGLPFESIDNYQMVHVPFRGTAGQWLITVIALVERDEVVVYSIYPDVIPEAKQLDLMVFMTRANFGLTQGNFEMDLDTGELRCRTSLDFGISAIAPALFDSVVQNNMLLMEQYYIGIQKLLDNQWTIAEAIDRVESA